jgi:hypothetical protein
MLEWGESQVSWSLRQWQWHCGGWVEVDMVKYGVSIRYIDLILKWDERKKRAWW